MENSKIEWCDHTFNPWTGCTKVSSACDHCYAEGWAKRSGTVKWGNNPRRRTTESNWRQPLKWNKAAKTEGVRRRVFCASLADVFDNQVDPLWRRDLWDLIHATRHLDWLLLTKRPQNISSMLPVYDWTIERPLPNVWLGVSVEDQARACERIPLLLQTPAAIRFLSGEPLLGPVNLTNIKHPGHDYGDAHGWSAIWKDNGLGRPWIDWVIAGGESGPGKRPVELEWLRSLRDQCKGAGVPCFIKQIDKVQQIPDDLMTRQFPAPQPTAPESGLF